MNQTAKTYGEKAFRNFLIAIVVFSISLILSIIASREEDAPVLLSPLVAPFILFISGLGIKRSIQAIKQREMKKAKLYVALIGNLLFFVYSVCMVVFLILLLVSGQ